jgi:hypothetical protein
MNWKAVLSLTVFAAFLILSIGHNFPAFRSAMQSLPYKPVISVILGIVLLVVTNAMTVYQLWTGKASTWDWESPEKGYQGWLLRSEHPFGYWFRVLLWTFLAVVFDAGLVATINGHGPPP